jgi:hypothetical protein
MAVPAPVAVTLTTVAVAVLGPAPLASAGLAPAGRPAASTPTSRASLWWQSTAARSQWLTRGIPRAAMSSAASGGRSVEPGTEEDV